VFYAGRHRYVMVPPSPPNPDSFTRVARTALLAPSPGSGRPGLVVALLGFMLALGALALWFVSALDPVPSICLALVFVLAFGGAGTAMQLERARSKHPDEAVDGVRALKDPKVRGLLFTSEAGCDYFLCEFARAEYDLLAAGEVDSPNDFQVTVGRLALSAPDDPSPFNPARTNRGVMLRFVGRTFGVFPAAPLYHLSAPVLDGTNVTGLRLSSEDAVARWLAGAAPHQSMREAADTDALTCGDPPLPVDVPLSRIRVPLLLIAAAGGYGEHAVFSTTQVGSTDVTAMVIRQLPVEREAEDFGHADLLFAPDAVQLAWQPLLAWLRRHARE